MEPEVPISMSVAPIISATSLIFSYFVNNFGHYNKVYGSIGTLMVIMLWLHFNSVILLIGFELNASIDKAKAGRAENT